MTLSRETCLTVQVSETATRSESWSQPIPRVLAHRAELIIPPSVLADSSECGPTADGVIGRTAHARAPERNFRAINGPLAKVNRGQSRVLADNQTARSAAVTAAIRQIPKLIVLPSHNELKIG